MSSVVFFEEMTNTTASTTTRVFRMACAASAILALSPAIKNTPVKSESYVASELPETMNARRVASNSFTITKIDEIKNQDLPPFTLEWIDAEIDAFMTSINNGDERQYSEELLSMADDILKNNPQAFKDFT